MENAVTSVGQIPADLAHPQAQSRRRDPGVLLRDQLPMPSKRCFRRNDGCHFSEEEAQQFSLSPPVCDYVEKLESGISAVPC